MTGENPPTVGVTGLGEMGKIYGNIAHSLGCPIVGSDVNANLRRDFAEATGAETYEDCVEMYKTVDAVIIATPNKYHEKAATPAFERDLDVFIEKPLAHNHESAERIAARAADSDGICMVGYYNQFLNLCQYLQSAIDQGELGEILHVEARNIHRRHVPRRGSWYTSAEIAGGGVLQDKGSFVLDMLFEFGFGEVDSVTAVTRDEFGKIDDISSIGSRWAESEHGDIFDVEDSMTALIQSEEGNTATIELAWAANDERAHTYRLRGTDGGAHLDIFQNNLTLFESGGESTDSLFDNKVSSPNDDSPRNYGPNQHPLHRKAFAHFIECARSGDSPEHGTPDRSVRIQRTIDRIYDAIE